MPVIWMTDEERDVWMRAWKKPKHCSVPLHDVVLQILARCADKEDRAAAA